MNYQGKRLKKKKGQSNKAKGHVVSLNGKHLNANNKSRQDSSCLNNVLAKLKQIFLKLRSKVTNISSNQMIGLILVMFVAITSVIVVNGNTHERKQESNNDVYSGANVEENSSNVTDETGMYRNKFPNVVTKIKVPSIPKEVELVSEPVNTEGQSENSQAPIEETPTDDPVVEPTSNVEEDPIAEPISTEQPELTVEPPAEEDTTNLTPTRPLEEILADPNAKIGELIPYLKGTYEHNVELLSHLGMGEARGGTDESIQANYRVAVVRAFDPEVSNGDGDLESVIFWKYRGVYQWSCVNPGGGYWLEPDEQCVRNAEEFLSGNILEPEKGITAFFIGTVTRNRTLESVYDVPDWRDGEGVMQVYVYNKW